jgi:hypothetical protein
VVEKKIEPFKDVILKEQLSKLQSCIKLFISAESLNVDFLKVAPLNELSLISVKSTPSAVKSINKALEILVLPIM